MDLFGRKQRKRAEMRQMLGPRALILNGPKITKARAKHAIAESYGVITLIAARLGVTIGAFRNKIKDPKWGDIRELLNDEMEKIKDVAEKTVYDVMTQRLDIGAASVAARWYLEKKAKDRGYSEAPPGVNILNQNLISVAALNLPIEVRRALLEAIEEQEKKVKLSPESSDNDGEGGEE